MTSSRRRFPQSLKRLGCSYIDVRFTRNRAQNIGVPNGQIANVKDGVLVEGAGSDSIDQQRDNGQFGGDAFWEIKNGKKTRMVTDFTYNAITTDFWANLDAVGPQETWEHQGLTGDAKGQPVQSNHPSHGSSPCLIRKIMVGAAYA